MTLGMTAKTRIPRKKDIEFQLVKGNADKSSGLGNGTKGLTNGHGLTNGLRGRNGLTNSNGSSKGLVNGNGLTNGSRKGLTNGIGKGSNKGLVNGNGLSNGSRKGLTNGLVNGNGFTNGLVNGKGSLPAGHGLKKSQASKRMGGIIAALVVAFLLITGAIIVLGPGKQASRMTVDARFEDWSGRTLFPDARADASENNADIVRYGAIRDSNKLFFYIEGAGRMLSGEPDGGTNLADALEILMDTDEDASTGYNLMGIGADCLVQIWGRDGRCAGATVHLYNRSSGDGLRWNCWNPVGAPSTGVAGGRAELSVDVSMLGPAAASHPETVFHLKSWSGSEDFGDYVINDRYGALLARQDGPGLKILPKSQDTELLTVELTAAGRTLTLNNMTFTIAGSATLDQLKCGQTVIPVANGRADFRPGLALKAGQSTTLNITADLSNILDGESVGIWLEGRPSIDATNAEVTVRALGTDRIAYVGRAPGRTVIDGAFGDWSGVTAEPKGDCGNPDIDITGYSVNISSDTLSFYVQVDGDMLAGSDVPLQMYSVQTGPAPETDSDRDGVPDGVDLMPFDFNNDNIPDASSGHDVDKDGTLDFPYGNDLYISTRIASTFPAGYRDRDMAIYIGPLAELPAVDGRDAAYILIDCDSLDSTGLRTGGLGADYIVNITGKDGKVLTSRLERYGGSGGDWRWTGIGDVKTCNDAAALETSVSLVSIGGPGAVRLLIKTTDWTTERDWSDNIQNGTCKANGTAGITALTGPLWDPFVIGGEGNVYQSTDSAVSWSYMGVPGDGNTYTDITTGEGPAGGYVFILRNDGKVYFTDRGVSGWTQYGYGAPVLPEDMSYIALAAGAGPTSGYLYLLRSDGAVFFTDRGTSGWNQYGYGAPVIPTSQAYVDIACGELSGYIYALRNDGTVYFTDRGTSGWNQYGYGSPAIPASTAYVGMAAGKGAAAGYMYILRNDGNVYFTDRGTSGWNQYGYGSPAAPANTSYVGISVGDGTGVGYVFIMRNDGKTYFTDRGTAGWTHYGYGTPSLPASTAYRSIAGGQGLTNGYQFVLKNDGKVYFTDRGTSGWARFGYGAGQPPVSGAYSSISATTSDLFALRNDGAVYKSTDSGSSWSAFGDAGGDTSWVGLVATRNYVYALRNDGTIQRSPLGAASWTTSGADAGTDCSWVGISSDDANRIYALRNDGTVRTTSEGSWMLWFSKGDAGADTSWVSICAYNSTGGAVYAIRNDRTVRSSSPGLSSSWSDWASAVIDASWTGIAADDSYVYALRSDGRIDRAKISGATWSEDLSDVGTGAFYAGITTLQVPEFGAMALPLLGMLAFQLAFRRLRGKSRKAIRRINRKRRNVE